MKSISGKMEHERLDVDQFRLDGEKKRLYEEQ
jgi:hypothetical protein